MLMRLRAIAYLCIGEYYLQTGNDSGAAECFSKVIGLNPNCYIAHNDRGTALQGLGDYSGAIDEFDRAIELNPRLAMTYSSRGISWKLLGDHDRAIADQTRSLALAPKFSGAHAEIGAGYMSKHDFDRAITHLTRAIDLAPKNPSHLRTRGYAKFHQGDFEAAAVDLRRSLDLGLDAYAMLFFYLARARTSEKALVELEAFGRRLRTRQWPNAMIGFYLGRVTLDFALAAATNSDERAEAQFYLGEWHLLRNNHTEAVNALRTAALSTPTWFIEHSGAIAELRRLGVGLG